MSTPTNGAAPAASNPAAAPAPTENTNNLSAAIEATETDVDASDEGAEESPVAAAAAEAVKKLGKKKYKVKVDAVEEEVELDFDDEESIKRHLQMSKAAQKRMQQFAEYEKGVKGLIETLQKDPLKVLADPRLNIPDDVRKKMAESIINNELEEMSKSPEQKEKERLQREYDDLKKKFEDEKKSKDQQEFQRLQEQAAKDLDVEISSAIEKAGLPKNARTVKYAAEALMFALEHDIKLSVSELMPHVKKHALSEFREIISALPDEEFENWLGKDQISRIRKRSLAKLRTPATPSSAVPSTGESDKKKVDAAAKKVEFKDFFKSLGK